MRLLWRLTKTWSAASNWHPLTQEAGTVKLQGLPLQYRKTRAVLVDGSLLYKCAHKFIMVEFFISSGNLCKNMNVIQPFSSTLCGSGAPTSRLRKPAPGLLRETLRCSQATERERVPSVCPSRPWGLPPSGMCLEYLPREMSRRLRNRWPSHLSYPSGCEAALLWATLGDWSPDSQTPLSPILSCRSWPRSHNQRWKDKPVDWELCLLTEFLFYFNSAIQWPHHCSRCTDPNMNSQKLSSHLVGGCVKTILVKQLCLLFSSPNDRNSQKWP